MLSEPDAQLMKVLIAADPIRRPDAGMAGQIAVDSKRL